MEQYSFEQKLDLIEQLRYEEDFLQYINILSHFVQNYVVMLVACDTPWGPGLTKEMTGALRHIGFKKDIYGQLRQNYAAIIDAGNLLVEKLSQSTTESICGNINLDGDEVEFRSVSYDAPEKTEAYIKINGKSVSTGARGLNFVVYDKKKKEILDAVNFDVFGELVGKHKWGREKLIKDFLKEHPNTRLICFNTPKFPSKNLTQNEMFIRKYNVTLSKILLNLEKAIFAVNRYYDKRGVAEVLSLPKEILGKDRVRHMVDQKGELVNIVAGHRITELQPGRRKRTVFFLGNENVFGVGASDLHTMASFLQAKFDQEMPEEGIVVENYGQYFNTETKPREWKTILNGLPVSPQGGDIILWNTEKISEVPFVDMAEDFAEGTQCEIFLDKEHYTPHGQKWIADRLYEEILEQEEINKLKEEKDFLKYLNKLKGVSNRYTYIVLAQSSPVGKYFTLENAQALESIGLKENLYEKINYAYAAVVDEGKLIFEQLSSEPHEVVEKQLEIQGTPIEVRSWANGSIKTKDAYIKINGKRVPGIGRGLFFAVYDKKTQMVLDGVLFDTVAKNMPCMRVSERVSQIRRYQDEHPDVVLIGHNKIMFPKENWTENEKYILKNKVIFSNISKNIIDPDFILHTYYTPEEIREVCTVWSSYHDQYGIRHFNDVFREGVNIIGGHRMTAFQPETPKRTLFLLGGCNTFGTANRDEHTMASQLQLLLNQNYKEEGIIVQNYGFFLEREEDKQSNERMTLLEALPVKSGDIIFIDERIADCPYVDMNNVAREPGGKEIFVDSEHYTPDGQRLRAEILFEGFQEYDILSMAKEAEKRIPPSKASEDFLDENDTGELAEYKRALIDFYDQLSASTEGASEKAVFGSIVMNCNPFTKGHRYLIDQALTKCDYLVVFVVEEDKSIFPFEDRFRLVAEGTEDLPNVILIPSGKFIVSSLTFSEYFNKSELQDRVVDTSTDVLMFVREIAPCLHITKRFAGEEPFDAVTRQYNESMRKILPEYGMEFVEIPRAEAANEVISASTVRALLEKKEFEAVEKLVPETTYRYLVEKFR